MLNTMPHGNALDRSPVVRLTLSGIIIGWSEDAEARLGHRPDEALGHPIDRLVLLRDRRGWDALRPQLARGEALRDVPLLCCEPADEREPITATFWPIRNERGCIAEVHCVARIGQPLRV